METRQRFGDQASTEGITKGVEYSASPDYDKGKVRTFAFRAALRGGGRLFTSESPCQRSKGDPPSAVPQYCSRSAIGHLPAPGHPSHRHVLCRNGNPQNTAHLLSRILSPRPSPVSDLPQLQLAPSAPFLLYRNVAPRRQRERNPPLRPADRPLTIWTSFLPCC